MRITSQMMSNTYKRDVLDAYSSMYTSMRHAYNLRAFDKPSDDPLAASQTFNTHWQISLNSDYQSNITNVTGFFNTADSITQNIDKALSDTDSKQVLGAISGTMNSSERESIATQILKDRDAIVSKLNAKYGDSYLFSGCDSLQTPFKMKNDQLFYHGINVDSNAASVTLNDQSGRSLEIGFSDSIGDILNGYKVSIDASGPAGSAFSTAVSGKTITITADKTKDAAALQTYLRGSFSNDLKNSGDAHLAGITSTAGVTVSGLDNNIQLSQKFSSSSAVAPKLGNLANESAYVDIGLGISTDSSGNIDSQSAFDRSLPGVSFLGYGTSDVTDEDGNVAKDVPNNLISLMTKMAGLLKDGSLSNTELIKKISPYRQQYSESLDSFESHQTELGQNLGFLKDTGSYLSNLSLNLYEKDNDVEFLDPTQAIPDFYNQQNCYLACLKVGGQVLEGSLMDYLR